MSTALKERIAEARTAAPHMADFIDKLIAPVRDRLELAEQTSDWVMPNGLEVGADPNTDWRLEVNLRAIAAGYEPTTPPSHWYCGTLTELRNNGPEHWPNKRNEDERLAKQRQEEEMRKYRQIQAEQWERFASESRDRRRNGVAKFVAPLPRAAFDAYKKAEELFGESMVRIYSPDPAHFQETKLRAIDPVIIGCVGGQYYEVFRWDIASDIAAAINKVVK